MPGIGVWFGCWLATCIVCNVPGEAQIEKAHSFVFLGNSVYSLRRKRDEGKTALATAFWATSSRNECGPNGQRRARFGSVHGHSGLPHSAQARYLLKLSIRL